MADGNNEYPQFFDQGANRDYPLKRISEGRGGAADYWEMVSQDMHQHREGYRDARELVEMTHKHGLPRKSIAYLSALQAMNQEADELRKLLRVLKDPRQAEAQCMETADYLRSQAVKLERAGKTKEAANNRQTAQYWDNVANELSQQPLPEADNPELARWETDISQNCRPMIEDTTGGHYNKLEATKFNLRSMLTIEAQTLPQDSISDLYQELRTHLNVATARLQELQKTNEQSPNSFTTRMIEETNNEIQQYNEYLENPAAAKQYCLNNSSRHLQQAVSEVGPYKENLDQTVLRQMQNHLDSAIRYQQWTKLLSK